MSQVQLPTQNYACNDIRVLQRIVGYGSWGGSSKDCLGRMATSSPNKLFRQEYNCHLSHSVPNVYLCLLLNYQYIHLSPPPDKQKNFIGGWLHGGPNTGRRGCCSEYMTLRVQVPSNDKFVPNLYHPKHPNPINFEPQVTKY